MRPTQRHHNAVFEEFFSFMKLPTCLNEIVFRRRDAKHEPKELNFIAQHVCSWCASPLVNAPILKRKQVS